MVWLTLAGVSVSGIPWLCGTTLAGDAVFTSVQQIIVTQVRIYYWAYLGFQFYSTPAPVFTDDTALFFFMAKHNTTHLIQRPCYQRGSPSQDSAGNQTTPRPPDDRKETQTAVVWSCLPFTRSGKNRLAKYSEKGKKTRQTQKEAKSQRAVENRENGENWLWSHLWCPNDPCS